MSKRLNLARGSVEVEAKSNSVAVVDHGHRNCLSTIAFQAVSTSFISFHCFCCCCFCSLFDQWRKEEEVIWSGGTRWLLLSCFSARVLITVWIANCLGTTTTTTDHPLPCPNNDPSNRWGGRFKTMVNGRRLLLLLLLLNVNTGRSTLKLIFYFRSSFQINDEEMSSSPLWTQPHTPTLSLLIDGLKLYSEDEKKK